MENQTVTNLTEVNGLNMTLNFTEEVMVEHKIGSEKCKNCDREVFRVLLLLLVFCRVNELDY